MWTKRDVVRAAVAIIATMVGWGLIRLLFPSLDYFPPESLMAELERSWVFDAGIRKVAMAIYATLALVLMAVFLKVVQGRWPGRGAAKGLALGGFIGGVWALGFLGGWAFLGTTLPQELKNIAVDSIPLTAGGWLIGLAVGQDVPRSERPVTKAWLAVLLVAIGFVAVHALGATLLVDLVGPGSALLFVPTTALQIALLVGLGLWAGGMYRVLRPWLPFESPWARAAFFAFGVFGHCWTWFHLFIPVMDFGGVLHLGLLVGLLGAFGVFVGGLIYEWLARVIAG